MLSIRFSLLLAALTAAVAATAAPTVVDGDFETTVASPGSANYRPAGTAWTYVDNAGLCNGSTPWHDAAQSGGQYAFIQTSPVGTLTGTMTGLTAGASYTLSFYLGTRAGYGVEPLNVSVGNLTLASAVAPPDTQSGAGWTKFSYAFLAPSASTTVSFAGVNQAGDFNTTIDNVSVQAVPEPASLAALGLGGLALLRRRNHA